MPMTLNNFGSLKKLPVRQLDSLDLEWGTRKKMWNELSNHLSLSPLPVSPLNPKLPIHPRHCSCTLLVGMLE